jgi:hypothetical protein
MSKRHANYWSHGLEWLDTEAVFKRQAHQDALKFGNLNPLNDQ